MIWIIVCAGTLVILAAHLRYYQCSLGLPFAYLSLLQFNHVPGAFAHEVNENLFGSEFVATGIYFTAIGSAAFVAGVWLAGTGQTKMQSRTVDYNGKFLNFCFIAGWSVIVLISIAPTIPSLSAALDKGAAIWIIAVVLGLRNAFLRSQFTLMLGWMLALFAYPAWSMLLGGFLSYGATAVFIALSPLVVSARSGAKVATSSCLLLFLGLSLFVNWFAGREEIRKSVWGGQSIFDRVETVGSVFSNFAWFNPWSATQIDALDQRLNQNFFVGLAADRLENGQVDYLYGSSLWEAVISVVPRAVWPDKPVFGGSPEIVARMTGLVLSPTTSFGVGNVMEFHINFGMAGLIGGFLSLGWVLGTLDRKAAEAESQNEFGRLFIFFLPAAALIQPIGSLVELSGGAIAALAAAYFWKWLWERQLDLARRESINQLPGKG